VNQIQAESSQLKWVGTTGHMIIRRLLNKINLQHLLCGNEFGLMFQTMNHEHVRDTTPYTHGNTTYVENMDVTHMHTYRYSWRACTYVISCARTHPHWVHLYGYDKIRCMHVWKIIKF